VGAGDKDFGGGLRLAELLGALSLATDLAHQVPPETALRDALLSVAFARHLGLNGQELSDVYYLALVSHLGCTAYAEEQGSVSAGDDGGMRQVFAEADFGDPLELARLAVTKLASHSGPLDRVKALADFARAGEGFLLSGNTAICEAAARLGERLGVGPTVSKALNEMLARWDGKVFSLPPAEGVSLIARLTHLIRVAQIHAMGRGPVGAAEVIRKRRGSEFDPNLADAFLEVYHDLFSSIGDDSVWDQTLDAEPQPHRLVPQSHLEDLTLAFGDFTDIKSPFTLGHSRRVGALAAATGACLGLSASDRQLVRLTGYVHDLGSVSIPQRVFTKNGALNRPELEAVRLHGYHTERILSCSRSMQPLGALAGFHHERLDGSGYHRGATAAAQPPTARVLAAAEVHQSLLEERGWRPAYTPSNAAQLLVEQATAGALDRAAVRAVLEAAGQRPGPRRVGWPAGLTDREVEVLRLLAAGRSNRMIARALSVSEATVRTHALNIYGKTGVHSRAGIGLFAIEHDLIAAPQKISQTVDGGSGDRP
jgi:HD-GYP domain-containing protein (c-di-GMP phosphodiesterase class II)